MGKPSFPLSVCALSCHSQDEIQAYFFQLFLTLRAYYIVVVPLRKSRGGQFLNPLGSPEEMDLEEVSMADTAASCKGESKECYGCYGDRRSWEGWVLGHACVPSS